MTTQLGVHHFDGAWDQAAHGLRYSHPEAVFHVIDLHHPHRAARTVTAYANERRVFVRCTMTGQLHEHFELDHPTSHERLSRYELRRAEA